MNEFKIAGAVAGAALLSASSAALAAPASTTSSASAQDVSVVQAAVERVCQFVAVPNVQGAFSFSQAQVTPNVQIRDVFLKTSVTLCNTIDAVESAVAGFCLSVGGEVPNPYSATVDQIAEEQGSTSQLMGCSCTANSAGGWAVAQARVEGVSVESLAHKAGV